MGQQPDIFSDPHAGTPLRGDVRRVQQQQAEDDPRFSDPHAGEPLRVNASKARGLLEFDFVTPPKPEDFPVYNMAKGAVNILREIPAGTVAFARDLPPGLDADGSVHYPLEHTLKGIGAAHLATGRKAVEDFQAGDYVTAARRALNTLIPVLGPGLDASTDKMMQGDVSEGIGEIATNAYLTFSGFRPTAAGAARTTRAAGRMTPEEAAAVEFAKREGIPLDLGTASGSQFIKNLQANVGSTLGGANTVENAQAAQAQALKAASERLAARANEGGPAVTGVEAGEGVRSALQSRVKQFHGQANEAYSRLREAESSSPEEFVQARPAKPKAAPHVTPEQSFLLRWLENDLTEFQYQESSRMRGVRSRDEWQQARTAEEFNDAVYAPRVAGTPVQEMLHAAGIKGSRAEIAKRIERHLSGQKKDPRLTALADALKEAWDGQNFDFDLVSDDALLAAGLRRRDLKSPIGLPNYDEAGAAAFFPDSEYTVPAAPRGPEGASAGAEGMRFPVDLKPHREALRPLFDQLQKEKEITGVLHGDKARAAVALESLINGPDYVPMTTLDRALGPIKKLAAGADMRELRTPGQGVAARVVGELDTAVRGRAQAAGPGVSGALAAGRAATRSKHLTADVMKRIAPNSREPRAIFDALTRNKDAGIAKLRDVQKNIPDEIPNVARALLEDIFDLPTATGGFKNADGAWARWQKLGPESKAILFPSRSHRMALDNFFLLAKKIGEQPNPSGTARQINATNLIAAIPAYPLAKLLYSPKGVRALTGVMELPISPRASAARTAAIAQLGRVAKDEGVVLEFPAAAEAKPERQ